MTEPAALRLSSDAAAAAPRPRLALLLLAAPRAYAADTLLGAAAPDPLTARVRSRRCASSPAERREAARRLAASSESRDASLSPAWSTPSSSSPGSGGPRRSRPWRLSPGEPPATATTTGWSWSPAATGLRPEPGLRGLEGRAVLPHRPALPGDPREGAPARHPPGGDRLGWRAARRDPRPRPAGRPAGGRGGRMLPDGERVFGVSLRRRAARLSPAHPRLARDAQRRGRRRAGHPELLHPVRLGVLSRHPLDAGGQPLPSALPACSTAPTS